MKKAAETQDWGSRYCRLCRVARHGMERIGYKLGNKMSLSRVVRAEPALTGAA